MLKLVERTIKVIITVFHMFQKLNRDIYFQAIKTNLFSDRTFVLIPNLVPEICFDGQETFYSKSMLTAEC